MAEPLKMIVTLVPKENADGQDDATEPASPRFAVDVAVSRRQGTSVLVTGELMLSGTLAHAAVHPVRPV